MNDSVLKLCDDLQNFIDYGNDELSETCDLLIDLVRHFDYLPEHPNDDVLKSALIDKINSMNSWYKVNTKIIDKEVRHDPYTVRTMVFKDEDPEYFDE